MGDGLRERMMGLRPPLSRPLVAKSESVGLDVDFRILIRAVDEQLM